jgi:hypothetical protein
VLRRCKGPQTLSGGHKVFVERLLLFLLGCLLLCLLRFLGHVALHDPQGWFNASRRSTRMHSEYTTIAKLILRASKKVSARHSVATTAKAFGLAWTKTLPVAADEVIK